MKLSPPNISIQKGSSISAEIPFELEAGENINFYRPSAYIKSRAADKTPLCILDAKVNVISNTISVSVGSPRVDNVPAGCLIYYIEMARGTSVKTVAKGALNVEP